MFVLGFKSLEVWKKSKDFSIFIYELTKDFPKEELYALTSQIRRAVISIPSNIAEGSAKKSVKEKLKFVEIACGSFYELATQIEIAKDIKYISDEKYNQYLEKFEKISKLLFGYRKALNSRMQLPA